MRALPAALIAIAGCSGGSAICKPGTVLVSLLLPDGTDELDVSVAINGVGGALQIDKLPAPASSGTLEVDFSDYPVGKQILVTVVAKRAGVALAQASNPAHVLAAGCDLLMFTVGERDMGAGPDLAGFDQGGPGAADLAACVPPSTAFPIGKRPVSIVAGDWNGDEKPDIAVASNGDNRVYTALNGGGGKFGAPLFAGTGMSPQSLTTGDWNGDGKADLAVANQLSASATVLVGVGDGSFTVNGTLATGTSTAPQTILTDDFNHDGKPDLATANDNMVNNTMGNVSLFVGAGNGSFTSAIVSASDVFPYGMTSGDWNGDKYPDLAVTAVSLNSIDVLINNQNDTFKLGSTLTASSFPSAMANADFNRDGHLDLAAISQGSSVVVTLLGVGDGTFQPQVKHTAGMFPAGLLARDLDGDGKADLAVANSMDGTVSILYGLGDGTFAPPVTFPVGTGPSGIAAADFDGDGRLDLAVVNSGDNSVSILLDVACR